MWLLSPITDESTFFLSVINTEHFFLKRKDSELFPFSTQFYAISHSFYSVSTEPTSTIISVAALLNSVCSDTISSG